MDSAIEACLDCLEEVEHCHGVMIIHASGSLECAEQGCVGNLVVHEWTIQCTELLRGCSCDRPRYSLPLAA